MAPPPSPSFLLDWRVPYVEFSAMISVSEFSARFALLDGLRLPSRRLRPSPKPIATEGTPIARMREHTTAARPEKRKDFMHLATPAPQLSCGAERVLSASYRSPGCLVGLTETGTSRSSAVRMIRVCSTVCAAG